MTNSFCGKLLRLAVCALFVACECAAQTKPAADLIITNGKIWTVDKSTANGTSRSRSGRPDCCGRFGYRDRNLARPANQGN